MSLERKRTSSRLRSTCILAVGLITSLGLVAQQDDQASTRTRAMALEQAGQNAEAEQIWLDLAAADPQNAEALAHLGLLEARQQHYDKAIDYYRRAAAIHPDLPGLDTNLGLALFKAAQFPDAIKAFTTELKKHPGEPRLTILLGMAHYGMKDYLVAIPYLQRAAEHDPQNVALRITLAQSCLWSKQYPCVLSACKEIRALQSNSADAHMLAAEALDQTGDTAGAEQALRAGIEANPTQPDLHFALGYLLWSEKKWPEAANEFQSELQVKPDHLKASIYLADSWVQQTEYSKALPELEKLVAANPSEPMIHLDLAIIDAHSSRSDDALRELKMAERFDPEHHLSHTQKRASLEETIDSIESPAP